jgi:hypothetical protein
VSACELLIYRPSSCFSLNMLTLDKKKRGRMQLVTLFYIFISQVSQPSTF